MNLAAKRLFYDRLFNELPIGCTIVCHIHRYYNIAIVLFNMAFVRSNRRRMLQRQFISNFFRKEHLFFEKRLTRFLFLIHVLTKMIRYFLYFNGNMFVYPKGLRILIWIYYYYNFCNKVKHHSHTK